MIITEAETEAYNYDLENVVTPVDCEKLEYLLKWSNYDPNKTDYLVSGFRFGFDIGYEGPKFRQDTARNIPFKVGNAQIMWDKIMKEVKAKRFAGPFDEVPFENFIQSPIGLVPKSGGDGTRLIFHLSYNFKNGNRSLNYHTNRDLCSVHYNDLDYAIRTCFALGKLDCMNIFYSKTDIKSAFRLVPLKKQCFCWLIMSARNPKTGKFMYFADKCLPFGASISCSIFQEFSESLRHIFEYKMGRSMMVTNYLDNFLFVDSTRDGYDCLVRKFLELCEELNVPVAEEKTEWASTEIKFLGILLDGKNKCLTIPEDKRLKTINWLKYFLDKKKSTIKELQRLSGLLNFLTRAIFPGRAFTRRMYAKFRGPMKELRPYHHVRLDQEFKSDCMVWLEFLSKRVIETVSRPFVDFSKVIFAEDVNFTSDASASRKLGWAAVFDKSWTFSRWGESFIESYNPSIEFLELYALCVGVFTWIDRLQNSRIWVHCDNQAVCGMINKNNSSSCRYCMVLLRKLVLKCLQHNLRIFAVYITSKDNDLSDSLSRIKIHYFRKITRNKGFDLEPTCLSLELWPPEAFWKTNCLKPYLKA